MVGFDMSQKQRDSYESNRSMFFSRFISLPFLSLSLSLLFLFLFFTHLHFLCAHLFLPLYFRSPDLSFLSREFSFRLFRFFFSSNTIFYLSQSCLFFFHVHVSCLTFLFVYGHCTFYSEEFTSIVSLQISSIFLP